MSQKRPRPDPASLGLPHVGVETHAHLDMDPFRDDLAEVLERAAAAGVAKIGNVFMGPGAYRAGKPLFDGRDNVFFILGVHPHDASGCTARVMDEMREIIAAETRTRAVGETGLDYYWEHSPRREQMEVFRRHLDLAMQTDLPVVIHSRDAAEDTLAVLDDMGFSDRPVLWHCFGGGEDLAGEIMRRGWTASIPGTVTFAKAHGLRRAVAGMDLSRLVLETDCPYLAPEPYRGKRNEPAYLAFIAQRIAEIKEISPDKVWRVCADNANRFFGLD